jgi:hypothetical protein
MDRDGGACSGWVVGEGDCDGLVLGIGSGCWWGMGEGGWDGRLVMCVHGRCEVGREGMTTDDLRVS